MPRPTSLPVVYHLNETSAAAEAGGPGADVAEQALRRAVEAWTSAGSRWHGAVGFRVRDDDPDRSVVSWQQDWRHPSYALGVASPGRGSSGIVFNITLNAEHFEWIGNEIRLRSSGRLVDTLQSNLMFMIGASLGLGVSDERQALMRYDVHYESLQPDDIAGIRALYPPPPCGDGVEEHPEECDDGNQTDGDGCTADCRMEAAPETPDAGAPTDGGTPNVIDDAGRPGLTDGSATPTQDGSFTAFGDAGTGPSVRIPDPAPSLDPPRGLDAGRVDGGCAVRTVGHERLFRFSWTFLCAFGLIAIARLARHRL